jgi:serine/threonine protein kinase/tetratricopeptide (TPR) repeat protein
MRLEAGSRLGSYEVLGPLGAGGMGEVYRARDTRLDREIALKILPPDVAEDESRRQRLTREAKALASLNHPNIVTIHSVEEHDGVHFFTMEWVQGTPLSTRIPAGGLPTEELLRIAVPLVEAVGAAHEQGIIHRDLKPANVVVGADGRVKVLDFGLARRGPAAAADETLSRSLTQAGLVVGTVHYMSPEQSLGRAVDERSDIFSIGAVLYEMASGSRPFDGATTTEIIDRIGHAEPAPIARPGRIVPEELERIVRKCLETDPGRRYPTTRDLAVDLRNLERDRDRGLAIRAPGRAAPGPGAEPPIDSIAILPFENGTQDPEAEYLCDGLAECLINTLSRLPRLRVISRTSSFSYKGRPVDPRAIGRDLNVRAVLTGRMTQRKDRLLVSAELVDAAGNHQLWGGRYNRPLSDYFDIEEDLAAAISGKLEIALSGDEAQLLRRRHTDDPQAYQLYLKGREFIVGTPEQMGKASEYLEQAVRRAPDFALAYAGLAEAAIIQAAHGVRAPEDARREANAALRRALEIDPHLAEAHTTQGMVRFALEWDWSGAEAEFRRGVELNPGSAVPHLEYADYLAGMGRLEEAVAEARLTQQLDPLSSTPTHYVAYCLLVLGRFEEAASEFKKALDLHPNWVWGWIKLARTYQRAGRCAEALAAADRAVAETPREPSPLARAWLSVVDAHCGRRGRAEEALARLRDPGRESPVDPCVLAEIEDALGNKDGCLDLLERAHEQHSINLIYLKLWPHLSDSITASEPRYRALVEKMKLA